MPQVARRGDRVATGHGCDAFTTLTNPTGATVKVYANGIPVECRGDSTEVHAYTGKRCSTKHQASINVGSKNVFVGNKPLARLGDSTDSGSIVQGSPNVFAGPGGASGQAFGGASTALGGLLQNLQNLFGTGYSSKQSSTIEDSVNNYITTKLNTYYPGTATSLGSEYAKNNPGKDPYKDPELIAEANKFLTEGIVEQGTPAALGILVLGTRAPQKDETTGAWYNVVSLDGPLHWKIFYPDGTTAEAKFDDTDEGRAPLNEVLNKYKGPTTGDYGLQPGAAVDAYNKTYSTDWVDETQKPGSGAGIKPNKGDAPIYYYDGHYMTSLPGPPGSWTLLYSDPTDPFCIGPGGKIQEGVIEVRPKDPNWNYDDHNSNYMDLTNYGHDREYFALNYLKNSQFVAADGSFSDPLTRLPNDALNQLVIEAAKANNIIYTGGVPTSSMGSGSFLAGGVPDKLSITTINGELPIADFIISRAKELGWLDADGKSTLPPDTYALLDAEQLANTKAQAQAQIDRILTGQQALLPGQTIDGLLKDAETFGITVDKTKIDYDAIKQSTDPIGPTGPNTVLTDKTVIFSTEPPAAEEGQKTYYYNGYYFSSLPGGAANWYQFTRDPNSQFAAGPGEILPDGVILVTPRDPDWNYDDHNSSPFDFTNSVHDRGYFALNLLNNDTRFLPQNQDYLSNLPNETLRQLAFEVAKQYGVGGDGQLIFGGSEGYGKNLGGGIIEGAWKLSLPGGDGPDIAKDIARLALEKGYLTEDGKSTLPPDAYAEGLARDLAGVKEQAQAQVDRVLNGQQPLLPGQTLESFLADAQKWGLNIPENIDVDKINAYNQGQTDSLDPNVKIPYDRLNHPDNNPNSGNPNFNFDKWFNSLSPEEQERQTAIAQVVALNGGYGPEGYIFTGFDYGKGAISYPRENVGAGGGIYTDLVFPDGTKARVPPGEDPAEWLSKNPYDGPTSGDYGLGKDTVRQLIEARATGDYSKVEYPTDDTGG